MKETPSITRRVHDLAKEWGLEAKDLAGRLEKIGIRNRRAQSTLSEDEIIQAARELGLGPTPTVTIGGERIVTSAEGQQLVERRVGSKVIRRRASTPSAELEPFSEPFEEPADIPMYGLSEPLIEAEPEFPEDYDVPVELPPLPTPPPASVGAAVEATPSPSIPTPEPAPPPPPPPPPVAKPGGMIVERRGVTPARAAAAAATAAPAMPGMARPMGPRVLGRIDLKKVEADRVAALERPSQDRARRPPAQPGAPSPADVPPPATDPSRVGKRKKRRVIEKPEFAEIAERQTRRVACRGRSGCAGQRTAKDRDYHAEGEQAGDPHCWLRNGWRSCEVDGRQGT
jgi:hypothetical protein